MSARSLRFHFDLHFEDQKRKKPLFRGFFVGEIGRIASRNGSQCDPFFVKEHMFMTNLHGVVSLVNPQKNVSQQVLLFTDKFHER